MLKPKEKAEELVGKFYPRATSYSSDRKNQNENARQCALISVDEILKVYESLDEDADIMFKNEINYWEKVKQEIEKL